MGFGKKDYLVFIDCCGLKFVMVLLLVDVYFWIFNMYYKYVFVDGFYVVWYCECMEVVKVLGVLLFVEVDVV